MDIYVKVTSKLLSILRWVVSVVVVVDVDYQKHLIADSPDYENTRGNILFVVCAC